jgi:uncharacterized protein YkwD
MKEGQQPVHGTSNWTNGRYRALFASLAAFSAIVLAMVIGASPASAGGGCANANLSPSSAAETAIAEKATRCLINRERRKHGLRKTKYNGDLQQASDWQAQDMLSHAYFAHQRSGGPAFTARITRFGYGDDSNGYSLGENIAWSTTGGASAREMVSMWMNSPGHRANILRKQFKEQAVSALYSPGNVGGDYEEANGPFVVYVSQFGTRY